MVLGFMEMSILALISDPLFLRPLQSLLSIGYAFGVAEKHLKVRAQHVVGVGLAPEETAQGDLTRGSLVRRMT